MRLCCYGLVLSVVKVVSLSSHYQTCAKQLFRKSVASLALSGIIAQPALAVDLNSEQKFCAEAWRATDSLFYERTFNGLDWFGEREALVKKKSYTKGGRDEARDAVASLLKRLGDKYTRYVYPEEYLRLAAATVGDARYVAGAGVQLIDEDDKVIVNDVEPKAPGDQAGLRPGDTIVAVEGEYVKSASRAAALLRGEAESLVKIDFKRENQVQSTTVNRALVTLSSVRLADQGVIRIRNFALDTADLVQDKATLSKGRLTIDLRGNSGGSLEGGIETARLFLKTGQRIVTVVDKKGQPLTYDAVSDGPLSLDKVQLLVDKNTASAAEVFAAALQQNNAALIVGANTDRTFGKGVIQTALPLGDPPGNDGAVAVTVATYSTPNGDNINGKGLTVNAIASSCTLADSAKACLSRSSPLSSSQ